MNIENLKDFDLYKDSKVDLSNFDNAYVQSWNDRSFFAQMLDVWGEMNYTKQSYDEFSKNPTKENKQALIQKASKMHEVCDLVVNNPNVYAEEKETLRFAEWQFYQYIFGRSEDSSAIKWFDQWCYDINYDLV